MVSRKETIKKGRLKPREDNFDILDIKARSSQNAVSFLVWLSDRANGQCSLTT